MQGLTLSRIPLFGGLAEPELQQLSALLRHRRYARNEIIFLRGDPGVNLCVIESGRVKLSLTSEFQGREISFAHLEPNDVFGELALLDGDPRSADAIAVEPTQLLLLARDDFLRFLHEHPPVAIALLADMSRRLRRDADIIEDAAFFDVPARLARVILKQAIAHPDGTLSTPKTTQRELAALAFTTRETLNKWLGIFADQALIRWENSRVLVLNKEGVRKRIY
ncbi:MAG: Crp/Fnr family transcriptional regulator [Chloroflexota bacterium]